MPIKMIDDDVRSSVMNTLADERLFRYDCENRNESITAILEREFAKKIGSRYCVALNSCSSGLFISLLTAGIRPGDHVAIPAFTFIAVPSAVVHAGAIPVLIEMTDDYVIDIDDLESKIKTRKIKALLLSYMRGRVPDLDRIIEICRQYNVIFLEDSAHALGVLYKGKQTGTFGRSAAFSAQSNKMIDGGEGGLFVTDDKQAAFEAMFYSGCYERNWKKHFGTEFDESWLIEKTNKYPAFNFRMSNLSAAALVPQIGKVEERVRKFNKNYELLVSIIGSSKYIRIPKFVDGVRPAPDSIQWEFIGLSDDQIDQIENQLLQRGVKVEIFKGLNARCFWNWGFFDQPANDCPKTRQMLQRTVDMRLKLHLNESDIRAIGEAILHAVAATTASNMQGLAVASKKAKPAEYAISD